MSGRLLDVAHGQEARAPLHAQALAAWAASVHTVRKSWVVAFDGAQFSVGRAWYTHLEQGRASDYFAAVPESDASVERVCPGLQDAMLPRAPETSRTAPGAGVLRPNA